MSYRDTVTALAEDAEQMEHVYQQALQAGQVSEFQKAIEDSYTVSPENLLYAAWFHRLKQRGKQVKSFTAPWGWVLPLAGLNGLVFWWLSDERRYMIELATPRQITTYDFLPAIILWAAPVSAGFVLLYLTAVGRKKWLFSALIGAVLLAAVAYVLLTYSQTGTRPFQEQYLTLMAMHLPLLAWAGVGAFLIVDHHDPTSRFTFLIKSLEIGIMGGLLVIAGGLFSAITIGLFAALNVDFPVVVQRLFFAGGGGLIPVVATAVIYNPTAAPTEQSFDEGLSKLVALLMRILLPLTLLVLLVYLAFIPFNFFEPFDNRDVLIIYNGMLFAVMALLVGATPVRLADLSPPVARWLRRGILAVAALAFIVSLYALAAIVYRTAIDRLTPNRLTFIGWNVINIGLLFLLLLYQARLGRQGERSPEERWLPALFRAFSAGTAAYAIWIIIVILAIPWLFGINQGEIGNLPEAVQTIVYEQANPILLKCSDSPHIYLLDRGDKRWIDTIETFNDRGYVWRDVRFVSCSDLRSIPDGRPIPADAGPPPQP